MEGHLNLPKRVQEPSGFLNNTFSDGNITYTIEAPREWWEGLRSDKKFELKIEDYRIKNPKGAMYDTFPTKLDI